MILSDPLPRPGVTLAIQASAGTGKTWTMSTLAVRFIAEQGLPVSSLAIVTFSSAAATEVKWRTHARLLEGVAALEAGQPPGGADAGLAALWCDDPATRAIRRDRLKSALADFDLAPIMTTHGFCDRLLGWLGCLADHDQGDRLEVDLNRLTSQATTDQFLRLGTTARPPFSLDQGQTWVDKVVREPTAAVEPSGTPAADFVEAVRREVDKRKRLMGLYTFDDMLVRCRDALADPVTGEHARARVSEIFPVLLVDEFQDTDSVQWQIIESGFVGRSTVVLIGDPKQSIYGFRGADVQAYLKAITNVRLETIDVNYRSSPGMIEAVGTLVNGVQLGDPGIEATTVVPAAETPSLGGVDGTAWARPLRIRVPASTEPAFAAEARQLIDDDLTADLTALLDHGATYAAGGAPPRPLAPADIGVIVSTNRRGAQIAERLRGAGLPVVFTGTGSVFTTPAADDWQRLLRALESGTSARIRAASQTHLIGWDLNRLVRASTSDFADLGALMRRLGAVLDSHGPMGVLEWLKDRTDLVPRLAAETDGEQTLADLHQICHLLSQDHGPLTTNADWLAAQQARHSSLDDAARRLPAKSDAIRVLTVHQAKGLQFAVVYLPELADRYTQEDRVSRDKKRIAPVDFHKENGDRAIDLGVGPDSPEAWSRSLGEQAGESLRACYVALTRATVHLVTWWVPSARNLATSPLQRLLFRDGDAPAAVIPPAPNQDPRQLVLPGVSVETMPARPPAADRHRAAAPAGGVAASRTELTRPIDSDWRRTSFSALTAAAHQEVPVSDEPAETPAAVVEPAAPDAELDRLSPMSDLPGGAGFGTLVHSVFEQFDPTRPEIMNNLVARAIGTAGLREVNPATLTAALSAALSTPLGEIGDNLTLADIPLSRRRAEMTFELALTQGPGAPPMSAVADLLSRHLGDEDALSAYPEYLTSPDLDDRRMRGFLTGSVDAVLNINNRFVIVDYKTNRLGPPDVPLTLRSYTRPAMAPAMMASHYPLQVLLYAVALHRFLRWRLPDYDPVRHLGGVAYLFVRGMAGPDTPVRDGTPCGVFDWRPPAALITDLSDLLSGEAR